MKKVRGEGVGRVGVDGTILGMSRVKCQSAWETPLISPQMNNNQKGGLANHGAKTTYLTRRYLFPSKTS